MEGAIFAFSAVAPVEVNNLGSDRNNLKPLTGCAMSFHNWGFILTVVVIIAIPTESLAQTGSGPSLFGAAQELPLFPGVAADDGAYEISTRTFLSWRWANIPVELHVFQMGAHGFVNKGGGADRFMDRVTEWMLVNGWLAKGNS